MGVRTFLKKKIDKHGGVAGLAMAVVTKPVTMMSGGRGTRSAAPASDASPEAIAAALAELPKKPDGDYVAVAKVAAIQNKKPGQYEVHGHAVAVFRSDGKLFAVDNACLHEDGPLGEADQDGHTIACAYHNWKYDVRDGTCLTFPERRIACYDVREKDGFVWIGKQRTRSSEDRGGEHDDGLRVV